MNISEKITFLNRATLESLNEVAELKVIENFTEVGLKILEADFGFAFWKEENDQNYKLAYKSGQTPYEPNLPRENGYNAWVEKNKTPYFLSEVIKESDPKYDLTLYMKSIVIIPVIYKNRLSGPPKFVNLVLTV
jgi:hypothetical protein